MTRYIPLLSAPLSLYGCLAPPLKPVARETAAVRVILAVPVESPPLETIPDALATRLPIQWRNDDLPFDAFLERKVYLAPGGVLIAGGRAHGDSVPEATFSDSEGDSEGRAVLAPIASAGDAWMPAFALAREAAAQLSAAGRRASVRRWYNRDISSVEYGLPDGERIDAILEIGGGDYRIVDAQAPLQILLKPVDPVTRRTLGRIDERAFPVSDDAATLLADGAARFKRLFAETGAELLRHGLDELGLLSAPQDPRIYGQNADEVGGGGRCDERLRQTFARLAFCPFQSGLGTGPYGRAVQRGFVYCLDAPCGGGPGRRGP